MMCIGANIDLREGSRYRVGYRFPDGSVLWLVGGFGRFAAPFEPVYAWRLEGGPGARVRVTVRFDPDGDGTRISVLHERMPSTVLRDEHARGRAGCLHRLRRHFDRPQPRI